MDKPFAVVAIGLAIVAVFTFFCVITEAYLPSPTTWRDFFDYEDIRTQMFDAREAAFGDLQKKQSPDGRILSQSIVDSNWMLVLAFECESYEGDCETGNALNPTMIRLLQDVDQMIEDDPDWKNICLRDLERDDEKVCANSTEINGKTAKVSPL